ncbi:MAG TPA: hypothetical protein VLC09_18355 [Polyangiaceae bacterium]|nr:hypothetical protein [Polyangiaceae bacterium]
MSEPSTPEVRPYLLRLVGLIVCAIILMASVATWAWRTYGTKLEQRPPLPDQAPPMGDSSRLHESRPGDR